jgi:hypothetical protein
MLNNVRIEFHVSSAGVAGDKHKLMVATTSDDRKESVLFNPNSLFSRWYATWKLKKMLQITKPQVINMK